MVHSGPIQGWEWSRKAGGLISKATTYQMPVMLQVLPRRLSSLYGLLRASVRNLLGEGTRARAVVSPGVGVGALAQACLAPWGFLGSLSSCEPADRFET